MAFEREVEEKWLKSIVIPEMVRNGTITYDDATPISNYKLVSIVIKPIGNVDGFSMAIYYKAKIEFILNGTVHETRNLMIKKTPKLTEEMFNAIKLALMFSNEINGYAKILPALSKFSKELINVPKFYYGDLQNCSAAVILEDFESSGWKMTKERVNLSLDHTLLAVKYLGAFHGVSFALKNMKLNQFNELAACLKESIYDARDIHEDWNHVLKISVKRVVTAAQRYHPKIPKEFLQEFENLVADNYLYGKERVKPVEPMATLCHGDYLRNNVAYKYDKSANRPIDIMMFDLQTMRYCSPMIDLTVFLALSVYKEVRVEHFDEIFNTYCEHLASNYIKHTGKNLPGFLSRESLLKEYVRFLPYSITTAASFLMVLVEPSESTSEESVKTLDEIEKETMQRGGEIVDCELAHQVREMYDMSVTLKVDISEGLEIS